jgi:uncharacterized protein
MISRFPVMKNAKDVKAFARKQFSNARGSHDWEHTERVFRLCMHIGQVERADLEVLGIAAYLHDIGRPFEDETKGAVCHAQKGAEMAEDFLAEHPVSNEQRDNIIHCIQAHRFRRKDRLFAGEVGAKIHNPHVALDKTQPYTEEDTGYREYKLKLCKIKDRMLTNEGQRLAEERHAFMETFFQRLTQEYEGNK